MCIAIYKPADKAISRNTLRQCFMNNSDGCGFAYVNTDQKGKRTIKIKKNLDFDDFYERYSKAARLNPTSPFLIHFRIRTHGKVDLANCHPFRISQHQVFIHNGMINKVKDCPKRELSDTRMFNQLFLRNFPRNWVRSEGIKSLVEDYINQSKLAVLDVSGEVFLFNEGKGHWHEGVWWSNYTYLDSSYSKYTGKKINNSNYYSTNYWSKRQGNHNNTNNNSRRKEDKKTEKKVVDFPKKQRTVEDLKKDLTNWKKKIATSTIPKHSYKQLEDLENDEWLADEATQMDAFHYCEVCDRKELNYLVTKVYMEGIGYIVCRDCLRSLDNSGLFYYQGTLPSLQEVYDRFFPSDEDDESIGDDIRSNCANLSENHFLSTLQDWAEDIIH